MLPKKLRTSRIFEKFQNDRESRKFFREYAEKIWLVGGTVRDLLLERKPRDYDFLLTDTDESDIKKLLPRAEKVGKAFPVYLWKGSEFSWTSSSYPQAELSSRDYTVNSLAVHLKSGEIHDPHGGLADLRLKILQPLPGALSDDPHRMYRGLRFLAEMPKFTMTDHCFNLMKKIKERELKSLAEERVAEEFKRVLSAPRGERFFLGLKAVKKQNVHFFWLDDNPVTDLKRWQSTRQLTKNNRVIFSSLALKTCNEFDIEGLRKRIPLAKKWLRAAKLAGEIVPVIRKWNTCSPEALSESYSRLNPDIISLEEIITLARAEDLRLLELSFSLKSYYYDNLKLMWRDLSREISGEDLPASIPPGPERGRKLKRLRTDWLREKREKYAGDLQGKLTDR